MNRKRASANPNPAIKAGVPEALFELHRLSDDDFEEICCNVLYYDKSINNPELHGRPRQRQFGVDITAVRIDGSGIDTASCKKYKSVGKGQIASFANEFLDHWETYWKNQRVQRFILCIACDLRSQERRREIAAEEGRFHKLGIKFEAWGQRQLSQRVREHPEIADTFFPAWRMESALSSPSKLGDQRGATLALLSSADVTQISLLQTALAGQIGADLDAAQLAMKRGERTVAELMLRRIREDPVRWGALTSLSQARILRMQGLLALQGDDTARCADLLDQADALSPNDEPRARALLTLRTHGRDEALAVLLTPTTADGALLRAGLLIEAERRLEAEDVLRSWESLKGQNAEWHRLAAYLACLDGNASQGLNEIEAAESLAGDWRAVIETGAIVRYAAALSPVARFPAGNLPEPIAPEFVRQDDASRKLLIEASTRFARLAAGESHVQWRQRFEIWRFACLALLAEHAADAQAACIALLNQDPAPAVAVFWALAREYAIPLKPLIRRFEKQLRTEAPSIDDLQAALACALAADDPKKAAAILTRDAGRFPNARAAELIQSWRGRIAIARKRMPAPETLADPVERMQALIVLAAKDGNWSAVDSFLRADTMRPELKFLACTLLAGHQQWAIVAFHMEGLLEIVATAAAVRLAIHAWFHTGTFDRIPKILDEYAHCFPGATPPYELKRLRTYAAVRRGDLPTALPLATELAAGSGEPADQTFLINLLLHVGDVEHAVPLLREVLPQSGWKPKELLHWVPAVASAAPELARLLIRKAMELNPDPAYAGFLVQWSYRLGLDAEANTLLGQFVSQTAGAAQASVRPASLAEVIAYMKDQARIGREMDEAYRRGDAPIHAIAGPARTHLGQLWHAAFQGAAGSGLFIRSGNRAREFFAPPVTAPPHLCVDTTALLTIDELGLWETLDEGGLSLTFGHNLLPVLLSLTEEARPQQPSRIAVLETLTEAVSRKEVQICHADAALTAEAAFVVFDLSSIAVDQSPPETAQRGEITLGALAFELTRRGGTTAEQVSAIRATYSGWEVIAQSVEPSKLGTLVFDSNTLEVAIGADLLDSLKAHFALKVTSEYHVKCLEEINEARDRNRLAEQLRGIHRRVAEGVRSGKYRILPEPTARPAEFEGKSPRDELLLEPLFEFLAMPGAPGTWIWIDDRACTSYVYANGIPIVSTFEVLDYLRSNARLPEPDYYALLDRLRGANVQILPLSVAEVDYWLKQAPVGEYGLTETAALLHLRLNFNRLLTLEPYLDLDDPPRNADRMPERSCLLDAVRIARECLQKIWADDDISEERRVASSDWIWNALRVERFNRLPPGSDPGIRPKMRQSAICQLFFVGLGLSSRTEQPDEGSRRQAYMQWLEHQLPELADEEQSPTLDAVGASLGEYLVGFLARQHPDEPALPYESVRVFIGLFVADLPEAIRNRLYENDAVNTVLKPNVATVVNLDAASFEAVSFWDALSKAGTLVAPLIRTIRGEEYQVHADSATDFRLSGPKPMRFQSAECALLSHDVAQRRQFLAGATWLDPELLPAELGGVAGIAELEAPAERMQVLQEQRERLPSGRYATLRHRMESGKEFSIDVLLPTKSDIYARYLGIKADSNGVIDWDLSATGRLDQVGLEETLLRWSGLPIPLPAALHLQYAALSDSAREALRTRLGSGDLASPLLALKLIELECRAAASGTMGPDLVHGLISALLAHWTEHANAFNSVLLWSDRVWHRDSTWHALSAPLRLACVWAHAGRILSALLVRPTLAPLITERFPTFHRSGLRQLLPFSRDYNSDIATPRRLTASALLIHGLSAAIGEDPQSLMAAHLVPILEHVSSVGEEGRVPSITLLADRRFGRNALGSFFIRPASPALSEQLELREIRILSDEGKDLIRDQALGQLEENPSLPEAWGMLHHIGYEWLPSGAAARVNQVVKSLAVPIGTMHEGSILIGHTLAAIFPYCDSEIRSRGQERLIEWAHQLASAVDIPIVDIQADTAAAKAAGVLIEQTVSLAREPTLRATGQMLGDLSPKLAAAWPAFASTLRALLARALREIPNEDSEGLWHAFVKLRSAR